MPGHASLLPALALLTGDQTHCYLQTSCKASAVQDAGEGSEDTQAKWGPQERPSMLRMLRGRERNRQGWTGSQQCAPEYCRAVFQQFRDQCWRCAGSACTAVPTGRGMT